MATLGVLQHRIEPSLDQAHTKTAAWLRALLVLLLATTSPAWGANSFCANSQGGTCINNMPLYLGSGVPPNVLFILANSQNMDENGDPSQGMIGAAIGGSSQYSKSEIARAAIRSLETTYMGQINLGLMTFAQYSPNMIYMYNSYYDSSYNPANYNPNFQCPSASTGTAGWTAIQCRAATTKLFQAQIPGNATAYYNYASPFYDGSTPTLASFCYSSTAKFDNTTNIPAGSDNYSCWANLGAGTTDGAPGSAGALYSNYLFSSGFVPTDSDYANNIVDFGQRIPSVYTSTAWFNNNSPGGGYLQVPLATLTSTQQSTINNKLTCNVPTAPANAPLPNPTPTSGTCNSNSTPAGQGSSSILNSGLTAIQGTLEDAATYFKGSLSTSKGAPSGYTIPNSCSKNYVVLFSNGLPSVNDDATTTSACSMMQNAITAAGSLYNGGKGPTLYVAGYELTTYAQDYFDNSCGVSGNPLDALAAAGGSGQSFLADNPAAIQQNLQTIFNSILQKSGSSAALTSNSTQYASTTAVYQASYDTADWSGHLQAESATNTATVYWDAANQIPAPVNRNLLTYNDSTATGVAFHWTSSTALSNNEQCLLAGLAPGCTLTGTDVTNGQNVLHYVRGYQVSTAFRTRTDLLGDIVDSNPLYAGTQDYGYSVLPGTEGSSYLAYVQNKYSSTYLPMIYVGANDGMLHAFAACASGNCPSGASPGQELFAYVPSAVYANLPALTQTSYNANHRYYVDGTPGIGDAFYGLGGATPTWHTVLVGTLGGGGPSVFAMDVTNPLQDTQSNASSAVLWEFPNTLDPNYATFASEMGYTWGPPVIARFNDGNYYAAVSNGYDSTSGHAVLFLIPVNYVPGGSGPQVIALDATPSGPPSGCSADGLSPAALVDADQNGTIDAIYAGDLCGNVWKFDVSNTNASKWGVAFTVASGSNKGAPLPLFTAKDSAGNLQPITAPLVLGSVPSGVPGTALVFFGTGQYLAPADTTNTNTQTLYGVLDSSTFASGAFSGGQSQLTRSNLQQQTILAESGGYRAYSSNTVSYPSGGSQYGWYMDLLEPTGTANIGERVLLAAQFDPSGNILFTSMIPNSGQCAYGGTGWKNYLDPATGGSPASAFLSVNGSTPSITLPNGSPGVAAGVQITSGIPSSSVTLSNGATSITLTNSSSNTLQNWSVLNKQGNPRASWSQIQ